MVLWLISKNWIWLMRINFLEIYCTYQMKFWKLKKSYMVILFIFELWNMKISVILYYVWLLQLILRQVNLLTACWIGFDWWSWIFLGLEHTVSYISFTWNYVGALLRCHCQCTISLCKHVLVNYYSQKLFSILAVKNSEMYISKFSQTLLSICKF